MEFFLDTADIKEIKDLAATGMVDGVTTNPSLMAKEGIKGTDNIRAHYKAICNIVDNNVSAEVIATECPTCHSGLEMHQVRAEKVLAWSSHLRPTLLGNPDERMIWLKNIWYGMPLYVRPVLLFLYRYFIRRGFLDGSAKYVVGGMTAVGILEAISPKD